VAGFLICSEIWYPEHGRAMGKRGAHLLLTPRRTGTATVEKWLVAGRAAATGSGCFSLSSNSVNSRNTDFGGGSWVIGPDGDVLALTTVDRPFATIEIDLSDAERAKSTYPRYMS
jgi:N-carbamoylputrescine amidase